MNHMNAKTLIVLSVAAAVAIIAAVTLLAARQPATGTDAAAEFAVPGLRDHVNDIRSIAVTGPENKPLVTIDKGPEGWAVKEKGGYPADLGKVRQLLLTLADASLLAKKTANPQRYAELGVSDVENKEAKGILLALDGLAQPARLIIGSIHAGGTFIRRAGDRQSWLAKGSLTVDSKPAAWLDTAIADISPSRMVEVVLHRPDGKTLRLFKQAGDANFKLAEIPKGREPASDFAANALGGVLAGLRLEDVLPAQHAEPPTDGKVYRAGYKTFDGLRVDLTAWKKDDKPYAQLSAVLDPAVAEVYIESEQAKAKAEFETQGQQAKEGSTATAEPPLAVSDPTKDRQQRLGALEVELNRLKQRFSGWTFVLPAYTFGNLDKSLEDLLKPSEPSKGGKKSSRKR